MSGNSNRARPGREPLRVLGVLCFSCVLGILGACGTSPSELAASIGSASPPALTIAGRDGVMPAGWEAWTIGPHKAKTRYRLESIDGVRAMRAEANASASGLIATVDLDVSRHRFIEFGWRVESLIPKADNGDRHAEDAPVRVILGFDGDKRKLPFRDQLMFEQSRLIGGRELPYATLIYIWANRRPVEAVVNNPRSDRIRMLVAESGPTRLRRWQWIRRNMAEDYRRVFKEEPGRLVAVGIMTDTDNTRERATAWYSDIRIKEY